MKIIKALGSAYQFFERYEMNIHNSRYYDFVNTFFWSFLGIIAGYLIGVYI